MKKQIGPRNPYFYISGTTAAVPAFDRARRRRRFRSAATAAALLHARKSGLISAAPGRGGSASTGDGVVNRLRGAARARRPPLSSGKLGGSEPSPVPPSILACSYSAASTIRRRPRPRDSARSSTEGYPPTAAPLAGMRASPGAARRNGLRIAIPATHTIRLREPRRPVLRRAPASAAKRKPACPYLDPPDARRTGRPEGGHVSSRSPPRYGARPTRRHGSASQSSKPGSSRPTPSADAASNAS